MAVSTNLSRLYVKPMMALAVDRVPAGDWRLEMKFDGYRAIATIADGAAELWSRNGNPLGSRYPTLLEAMARLPKQPLVIDGEIVALDSEGHSSFQLLQRAAQTGKQAQVYFYAFDLLRLGDDSFLERSIEDRQHTLRRLLRPSSGRIRLSEVFDVTPERLLGAARDHGWEGIIAKQAGSTYEPNRRSGAWLKCKVRLEQELVIGGFTKPRGSRSYFGALLVGYYQDDKLVYAGKVGTGFSQSVLADLHRRLTREKRVRCPFVTEPPERDATWVRPVLVGQFTFAEWTQDGLLRQAAFLGLRDDKSAREVRRETGPSR